MLDVNNVLPTPYNRQKDEDFADQMVPIKRTKKKVNIFKTKRALVPKQKRKEEGATVAASPTFPQRAASLFRRAVGQ